MIVTSADRVVPHVQTVTTYASDFDEVQTVELDGDDIDELQYVHTDISGSGPVTEVQVSALGWLCSNLLRSTWFHFCA